MVRRLMPLGIAVVVGALVLSACSSGNSGEPASGSATPTTPAWEPDGPVSVEVPFATGGGVDLAGRTLATILTEKKYVKVRMEVENREGGNGLVGMSYVETRKGDGDTLMVTGRHPITSPLLQKTDIKYSDFVPIATLYAEYAVFYVKPDSPIQTVADLAAKLKADPASVSIGGSVNGGASQLGMAVFAKAIGVDPLKLRYVPYDGDEAIPAVLGGQIDMATSGGESMDLVKAGQLKAIAVSADEPLTDGALAGVPTFKDAGTDASFINYRLVSGPPNMPAAAVAFWQNAFAQLVQTDEWKKVADDNGWSPYFHTTDVQQIYDSDAEAMTELFNELGLTANG